LLNSMFWTDEVWDQCRIEVQKELVSKSLNSTSSNGYNVAERPAWGTASNTIMAEAFLRSAESFLVRSNRTDQARHRKDLWKTRRSRVKKNFDAVDQTLENLHEVKVQPRQPRRPRAGSWSRMKRLDFVKNTAPIIAFNGDNVPVSSMPWMVPSQPVRPNGKRRIVALEIPEWVPDLCIQCGKCIMVCPHAVIRQKIFDDKTAGGCAGNVQAHRVEI